MLNFIKHTFVILISINYISCQSNSKEGMQRSIDSTRTTDSNYIVPNKDFSKDSVKTIIKNGAFTIIFNKDNGIWYIEFIKRNNNKIVQLDKYVKGMGLTPAEYDIKYISKDKALLFFYSNYHSVDVIENILDIHLIDMNKESAKFINEFQLSEDKFNEKKDYSNFQIINFSNETNWKLPETFQLRETSIEVKSSKLLENIYNFTMNKDSTLKYVKSR